jgi:hypothetical protein
MAAFIGSGAAICFSALMMTAQFASAMAQRQYMAIQLAQHAGIAISMDGKGA